MTATLQLCLSVPDGPQIFHLSPVLCPRGGSFDKARDPAGANVRPSAGAVQLRSLAATSEMLRLILAEPGCGPIAGWRRVCLSAGGIGTTAPLASIRMEPARALKMWHSQAGIWNICKTAVRC